MKLFKKILLSIIVINTLFYIIPSIMTIDENGFVVNASSVKISKRKYKMNKGEKYTLKITGTKKKVKWFTSNKRIATVNSKGKVTAKKKGKITITAKVGNKKYKCKITIEAPSINKKKYTIKKGKTYTLKIKGTTQKITWSSNNKKVASVNSKGKVKAKKKGTATITAKVGKSKYKCKIKVNIKSTDNTLNQTSKNIDVTKKVEKETTDISLNQTSKIINVNEKAEIEVTDISLNQTSGNIDVNEQVELEATITPNNATDKTVNWESSDISIATVDSNGKVTGVKGGVAIITASTNNNKISTYEVIVNITPNKIFEIDTANDDVWHTGQGMCTAKINGKIYYISAVIQTGTSDKDIQNTHIYILNESGIIVAIIADYSFGHANGITSSDSDIFIYNSQKTLFKIQMQDYVKNAIANYKAIGQPITSGFTENYITEYAIPKALTKSLYYDRINNKLYGTNENDFYEVALNENTATVKKLFSYSDGNLDAANAGLAIWGDYILKSVVYGYTSSHKYYENIIDIYRLDSEKTSASYVTSYKFISSQMKKYEIEDIDIVNNNTLAIHYNRSSTKVNHIYFIDPNELLNYK